MYLYQDEIEITGDVNLIVNQQKLIDSWNERTGLEEKDLFLNVTDIRRLMADQNGKSHKFSPKKVDNLVIRDIVVRRACDFSDVTYGLKRTKKQFDTKRIECPGELFILINEINKYRFRAAKISRFINDSLVLAMIDRKRMGFPTINQYCDYKQFQDLNPALSPEDFIEKFSEFLENRGDENSGAAGLGR